MAELTEFLHLVTRRKQAKKEPELLTVCSACQETFLRDLQGLFVELGEPVTTPPLEHATHCGYTFQVNDMAPCALHGDAYG